MKKVINLNENLGYVTYYINNKNELVSFPTEKPLKLLGGYNLLHESGCFNYIVLDNLPVEKSIDLLEQEPLYKKWYFNKYIKEEIDNLLFEGYCSCGKNWDGTLLLRFSEKFNSYGKIIYRNEFHSENDFLSIESSYNFKWSNEYLPKFNDIGVLYVNDITKNASMILNTNIKFNRAVISSISMLIEAGYKFEDIQISFLKGDTETYLTPFGYAPFTCIGFVDNLPDNGENVKIKLELKTSSSVIKRAVLKDLRIVSDI